MHDLPDRLLDLYRHAQHVPVAAFPAYLMRFLDTVVPFDMALFGLWRPGLNGGATTNALFTHNEEASCADEWQEVIAPRDYLLQHLLQGSGAAVLVNASEVAQRKLDPVIDDYLRRRRHNNIAVAGLRLGDNDNLFGLSIRRESSRWRYSAAEGQALSAVLPHIVEALRINRSVLQHRLASTTELGTCLAADGGRVVYQDQGFVHLCGKLFKDHREHLVPQQLMAALVAGLASIRVHDVAFDLHHPPGSDRGAFLITVRRTAPMDQLSDREQAVARLYGGGSSNKTIGATLGIAPSTVRRHVESIYLKLGISCKAELALVVSASRIQRPLDELLNRV